MADWGTASSRDPTGKPRADEEMGNEEAHDSGAAEACGCQKKANHNQKKRKKRVDKRTDEKHMRKWWAMAAIGVVWGLTLATVSTWNSYWLANEGTNHSNDVTWHQERRQMPGHWSPSQTPERQDKSQTNSCSSHTSEASDQQCFSKKPIKTPLGEENEEGAKSARRREAGGWRLKGQRAASPSPKSRPMHDGRVLWSLFFIQRDSLVSLWEDDGRNAWRIPCKSRGGVKGWSLANKWWLAKLVIARGPADEREGIGVHQEPGDKDPQHHELGAQGTEQPRHHTQSLLLKSIKTVQLDEVERCGMSCSERHELPRSVAVWRLAPNVP